MHGFARRFEQNIALIADAAAKCQNFRLKGVDGIGNAHLKVMQIVIHHFTRRRIALTPGRKRRVTVDAFKLSTGLAPTSRFADSCARAPEPYRAANDPRSTFPSIRARRSRTVFRPLQ